MLFVLLLSPLDAADVVLLRHKHGRGRERHSDIIGCVYNDNATDALFSPEKLLERVVLPDALWCDSNSFCHDSTSGREYVAATLVCNDDDQPIRCTVRIDCTELIASFWQSLALLLACIIGFIVVTGACLENRSKHYLDYDKDTSL